MAARRNYPKVRARLDDSSTIAVVGREAQTLILLAAKTERGLRAYDFAGGPPFRLAAYICDLRNKFGVGVATSREKHATGEHAVYTLTSHVEILAVDFGAEVGGGGMSIIPLTLPPVADIESALDTLPEAMRQIDAEGGANV